jgi:hypothetical protein
VPIVIDRHSGVVAMIASRLRWFGAAALGLASLIVLWQRLCAVAHNGGSIEVHVSACPDAIGNRSLFDACHASETSILDGPVRQTANTSGVFGIVTFGGLPTGEYAIAEAIMTGGFAGYRVFCSDAANAQLPVDYRKYGRAAVAITLSQDAVVTCDWYNIPPQTVSTVTNLPVAGTGPLGG